MSSGPPPRRRRIAGERRRPQDQASPTDAPSAPEAARPGASPPPPSASTPPSAPGSTPAPASPVPPGRPEGHDRAPSSRRAVPGLRVLVPLVLLTLVGLTYLVLMFVGVPRLTDFSDVREAEAARVAEESAPSIAERAAEAILAYDHRSLDADQAAATKFMTSSFAEKYSTTFDKTVKPAARTYRAQVTADIRGSSVVRASEDEVKVLLFVDQTTRSTANQRPQVALNRVEFVMVEQDGDWKVDDISSY